MCTWAGSTGADRVHLGDELRSGRPRAPEGRTPQSRRDGGGLAYAYGAVRYAYGLHSYASSCIVENAQPVGILEARRENAEQVGIVAAP